MLFFHTLHFPGGDLQSVTRQVKEAESESELVKQMTAAAKEMMERVAFAWDVYNKNLTSLETWLVKSSAAETRVSSARLSWKSVIGIKIHQIGFWFTFSKRWSL